ncbi:hypothetical protein BASA50_001227 [Batrachochytrium salamandrivorans]|uniref:Uncharacterized protein n=1 Tax=Batrachochytrium salamandrivorans TaxID=1357716 RepID=A0ABQ8EUW7_9FUNG|nr:hypothetical protein BASA60_002625 [Batrachochytrium salamandrivorans]KAH6585619.1 hypothetical protein BASA50_001227 [Batrachochytrium salamandrivorans]KAH9252873.1 hypothetical protein BASA81_009176 [Batrachochytrium salamandrivorans]KAH9271311.1 hypothetical protein BASA83_006400 [Batrachochytrium salamandrivorans]
MKLISFAALSFLAIAVSARTRQGDASQRAGAPSAEQSQSAQENPRQSLQNELNQLLDDYKAKQAAATDLQNDIDEIEKGMSEAELELSNLDEPEKTISQIYLSRLDRVLTIIRDSKRILDDEMADIKKESEDVNKAIASLDETPE